MTLTASEQFSGGEVRDPDGRVVVVLTATAGLSADMVLSAGRVRDGDGRRVVRQVGT